MSFDLGAMLKDVSNLDTAREQIEYIRLDAIDSDPNNFYQLSGIEELAANIDLCGLQQPVRVRETSGGRYVTVSGHRRRAALELLAKDNPERWAEIPCIVERDEVSPALQQLRLIYANANTRTMTSAELGEQAAQVEKLLYQLKEEGYEFPGRMRDHVAEAVNASKTKLARLKVIRDGLAECWQVRYKSGDLKEAPAYELARTPAEWQELIYRKFGKSESQTADLTSDAVATYRKRLADIEKLTCKKTNGVCSNKDRMRKKALEISRWYFCNCTKCCSECADIASCKYVCPMMQDKAKRIKQKNEERQKQNEAAAAERDRPDIDLIRGVYARFCTARKAKGLTVNQIAKKIAMPYSNDEIERMEDGTGKFDTCSRLPFGYSVYLSDVKAICAVADLLGCSIDYLLGREVPERDTMPARENVSNSDTWHSGNPPAPGWYICRIRVNGVHDPLYHMYWFGGKSWQGLIEKVQTVTHWMPVVEEDE